MDVQWLVESGDACGEQRDGCDDGGELHCGWRWCCSESRDIREPSESVQLLENVQADAVVQLERRATRPPPRRGHVTLDPKAGKMRACMQGRTLVNAKLSPTSPDYSRTSLHFNTIIDELTNSPNILQAKEGNYSAIAVNVETAQHEPALQSRLGEKHSTRPP